MVRVPSLVSFQVRFSPQVPLIVPVTLFRHYIFKYQTDYLMQQHYLYPHPSELKLRNHA